MKQVRIANIHKLIALKGKLEPEALNLLVTFLSASRRIRRRFSDKQQKLHPFQRWLF